MKAADLFSFSIRGPSGVTKIQVPSSSSFHDLKCAIGSSLHISVNDIHEIRAGYPPTLVVASDDVSLASLGMKGGALVVAINETPSSTTPAAAVVVVAAASPSPSSKKGPMVRRVVNADNSCLFTSFSYCMIQKSRALQNARQLRRVCCDMILRKPDVYNEVFLNKEPKAYTQWLMADSAWGGAIEVALLSEHFGVQVCVVDVQSGRKDLYGEGQYHQRCYLIYDGIHYDPLARTEGPHEDSDVTLFSSDDLEAEEGALNIARDLKAKHQFTDTSKFSLRCLVCGSGLAGEEDAMKHAQKTMHTNFAEYVA